MSETTIRDIAKQCGVSISTVSRALNNHPDINPATRKKVMEVIRETGFVPNNSAINLKKSDARSIALLVKGITNQFFSSMIQIMEDYAQKRDYATILRHVEAHEDEVQVALQLVKEKRLKGIVFLGGNFTHDESMLRQLNVPFVFSTVGTPNGTKTWYPNVSVDDRAEACKAVSYLIEQGHRRIAIITEGSEIPSVGQLRYEGYIDALKRHGIEPDRNLVMEVTEGIEHYSMQNGYLATRSLIQSGESFTGIFCVADVFAIGACRAVLEWGKRIPEDVSVVGYDGIDIGNYYNPKLTTIKQPVEEMADATILLLFDMIDKKRKPESIIMPAELVIRESSGSGYRR
jgi:DNA-binding LacI/PurR family transcriptional regulator